MNSVKLATIVDPDCIEALNGLLRLKMNATVAFNIMEVITKIEPIIENFNKTRQNLIEKYGEKIEDDKIMIKEENKELWTKEIEELLNTEVEIDIKKINRKALDNLEIEPIKLIKLKWLFEE